jgi:MYXO-CTERM domain-containing protein
VTRKNRINLALALMGIGIVMNIIVLFSGDSSPGWPIAAVILLGAAGVALLSERREY